MSKIKTYSGVSVIIIISFLVATKFFSFVGVQWSGIRYYIWGALIVWLIAVREKKLDLKMMPCSSLIIINVLFPLISILPCYLFHHQPIIDSLRAVYGISYPWLLYLYLHKYDVSPKKVIHIICLLGMIWTFLEIIQQFTYPVYYFAARTDNGIVGLELAQRNGIWRYMIQPWVVGYISCIYFWTRYLDERTNKNLICFFICILGIYLYVTRVIIFSIITVLFFSLLFSRSMKVKNKIRAILFIGLFSIPLIVYGEELFGSFWEQTVDQYENSDTDIRIIATGFYGYEYFPHFLTNIFGNGIPFPFSSYGKEINSYEKDMGLYRSDIGIVGDYNLYGFAYIIALIWGFLHFFKKKQYYSSYQVYSMIGLLLGYYIMSIFQDQSQNIVLAMLFYLCDNSFKTNLKKIC